jgi:hypothetical protein
LEIDDFPVLQSSFGRTKPTKAVVRRTKSPETSSKQADIHLAIPEPIRIDSPAPATAPRKPRVPLSYHCDVATPPGNASAFKAANYAFNIYAQDLQMALFKTSATESEGH